MNTAQIRQIFLDYFKKQGHTIVTSSSLIPAEDPTLLFTNAGMNQFKDCFLGKEKRSYTRASSIQKCVRAGGKHNDLDQVGFTERHLTFFEMMGNFSFGNYFKKDAIRFAWELLTKEYQLDENLLYVTVFKTDDEAYDIWHKEVGVPTNRIVRLGEKDNFWSMGDTGPCGPCTEIYVDQGATEGCGKAGCAPGCDCSRFTEIWNLVFMQFDRQKDGSLQPLAHPGVDTGMGFERLCMIKQKKKNVFHIDAFQDLVQHIELITGKKYAGADWETQGSFHVLADHIRTSSLLIADGCSPSNDGRGYVLRKIIRRAALFSQKLSSNSKLFSTLAQYFIGQMKDVYPELATNQQLIVSVLDSEIERFAENLVHGQAILDRYMAETKQAGSKVLTGAHAFKLYDTYGFPLELTTLIAKKNGLAIDEPGFTTEMSKQQEQSGKKTGDTATEYDIPRNITTTFVGYETLHNESKVQYFVSVGKHAWLCTKESPFYVECGGQVNDDGWVTVQGQQYKLLDLAKAGDTFSPAIMVKISTTSLQGKPLPTLHVGDLVESTVDEKIRPSTVKNHTATHMLQAALIEVLGPQVKQAGSLVNDKYLRFDFSHHKAMTPEEITATEQLLNAKIQADIKTNIMYATLHEAKQKGVISFFGEKYNPEKVRIVEIPGFSAELCGGTHAPSTGIIGCFKIISETALSTGTRRIVAITGPEALALFQQCFETSKQLGTAFKVKPEELTAAVLKQQQQLVDAQKTIKQLKQQLLKAQIPTWASHIQPEYELPLLYLTLDDASNEDMKFIAQELEKTQPGLFIFISKVTGEQRFAFYVHASNAHQQRANLKEFAQWLKTTYDLKGGGSAASVQGGGTVVPNHFREAIVQWLKN